MCIISVGQIIRTPDRTPLSVEEWDAYIQTDSELIAPIPTTFRDVRTRKLHERTRPHSGDLCLGKQRIAFFRWSDNPGHGGVNVQCVLGFEIPAMEYAYRIVTSLHCTITCVSKHFQALELAAHQTRPYAAILKTRHSQHLVNVEYTTPDNGGVITATLIDEERLAVIQGLEVFRGEDVVSITRSNIRLDITDFHMK